MTAVQSIGKRIDVLASIAMEARLRDLNIYQGFHYPETPNPSFESQQLDEARQIDVLVARHENLKKFLKAEKPTGIPHLFVLDPDKLSIGDLDAHTTLQAFANAQFSDSSQSAVAVLPPSSGFTVEGKAALDLVKNTILKDSGVVALESIDALVDWLEKQNSNVTA